MILKIGNFNYVEIIVYIFLHTIYSQFWLTIAGNNLNFGWFKHVKQRKPLDRKKKRNPIVGNDKYLTKNRHQ